VDLLAQPLVEWVNFQWVKDSASFGWQAEDLSRKGRRIRLGEED